MSAMPDLRDGYRREFAERSPRLAGAGVPWLAALRRVALERFVDAGFPTRQDEAWKYTDVSPIVQRRAPPAGAAVVVDAAKLAALEFDAFRLVFVDGRFAPALSRLEGLPAGVRVTSLGERLRAAPGALEARFARQVGAERHGFAALNLAFAADGAVIEIGPGIELESPIQLLSVTTGGTDAFRHLRHIVELGAGARAVVIETMAALGPEAAFGTTVAEVELAPGAALTHYRLAPDGGDLAQCDTIAVRQERDSLYDAHAVTLGGRLLRHELDCALAAEGAACRFNGLTVARGRTQTDTHTRFDHLAPHTTSREWVKAVLDDEARAVFSGRVVVHPDAQGSDAAQSNRNLLLSPRAEADSRPQLEIYADDVKCAHGAATGRLDPDQLFYLRSRGLPMEQARTLLVYAFAADALARVPHEAVRRRLARQLGERLLPGERLEELTS